MDEGILRNFFPQEDRKENILPKKLICLEEVTSTNDVAREKIKEGVSSGTIIIANSQSKGRGRLDRSWVSMPDMGVYMSAILQDKEYVSSLNITQFCGVSLSRSIGENYKIPVKIRWPNDLVIEHKKLGGILVETQTDKQGKNYYIIGVGINVNYKESDLPSNSTSLFAIDEKRRVSFEVAGVILLKLNDDLLKLRNNTEEITPKIIEAFSDFLKKRVEIELLNGKVLEGVVSGFDTEGALLLRLDTGFIQAVDSREVAKLV